MLLKVRFNNFKSFSKETIISLEPSKSLVLEELNTYDNVLKGCCFYGGNASGKTNALEAIGLLLDALFSNVPFNPHMFTLFNGDETMYFEYTFKVNDCLIVYYFELNRNFEIMKETLTIDGKNCLNRLGTYAETYLNDKVYYKEDRVDSNTLFLKTLYFNTKFTDVPTLKELFVFLKNSVKLNPISKSENIVMYDSSNLDTLNLIKYLDKYGVDEINNFFREFGFLYSIEYKKTNDLNSMDNLLINPLNRVFFKRENLPDVPLLMESLGNKVLLNILPSFLCVVKNGGLLLIDEFSSGLHNKLESLLVKYFFRYSKNAQLFFVSHSTNLLTTSLLRPDQIYSVDFDENGSFIKKFSMEKPRESQNLEKMYLSGVFGGIPLYEFKD